MRGKGTLLYKSLRRTIASSVTRPKTNPSAQLSKIKCDSLATDAMLKQFHVFFDQRNPVVLRGYAQDYPAIRKWKDLGHLLDAIGPDASCDVEVGAYNQGERLTLPFEG